MTYKVINKLCVQPEYCKLVDPENYCNPENCKDCDKDSDFVSQDSVVETNRQLLLDRSNVGIDKYGTTLTENKGDLRYWLNHALEECLDQANYLQRAIMELDAKNGNN